MGLEVVLEDKTGEQLASVEDPTNILHRVLPSQGDTTFRFLNCIDWYGDTIFNALQVTVVREELARLIERITPVEEVALLARIDELATRCQSEPHLFLKFYGD